MPFWVVRTSSRAGVEPHWPGCRLVATFTKEIGSDYALVEAEEAAIARVRTAPGVEDVEVAAGTFVGNNRMVYEVSGDGRQLRVVGRG